ncbi:reelin-like [Lineus longissimus]|uniref:reelin-like n=1 Tax=Lineus longissimus TaxID=88925 RepID=UPI00315D2A7D
MDDQEYNLVTTRDLDMGTTIPSDEYILLETMETLPDGWLVTGGSIGEECGRLMKQKSLVFAGSGQRRVCTDYMNLGYAGNLRFNFTHSHPNCTLGSTFGSDVFVYIETDDGETVVVATLYSKDYKQPTLVSTEIPLAGQRSNVKVCWGQHHHGGAGMDVWEIDHVTLLPHLPKTMTHFVQFNLNPNCEDEVAGVSVLMEYSTNHGRTWHLLHSECLPGSCRGSPQFLSSEYRPSGIKSWSRVLHPLPYTALKENTRFRWIQAAGANTLSWAIDDVYIGVCPGGCFGRGTCNENTCKCDVGYSGPSCELSVRPEPTMLIDPLHDLPTLSDGKYSSVQGGILGYDCGVVSSGKAIVFNGEGDRQLVTVDVNTAHIKYVQFTVRVGSRSSSCPSPDQATEAVYLLYSCDGGVTWRSLKHMAVEDQHNEPKKVNIRLNKGLRDKVCRFRWTQPHHSGQGQDVWAVDDIALTDKLYNTISVDFSDVVKVGEVASVHLGKVSTYCGRNRVLSFVGAPKVGESRYFRTDPVIIGPSFMLQLDLVMACSDLYTNGKSYNVNLEYSTDHGMNWRLVTEPCLPPKVCPGDYGMGTVYEAVEYKQWRRITVPLPSNTWSGSTRFRVVQESWSPTESWAIDNVYIGQQCEMMCGGHGACREGVCSCDVGYAGDTCQPSAQAKPKLHTDFSAFPALRSDWAMLYGGEVVSSGQGCGHVLSGESLYFFKQGPRMLVSHPLDTRQLDYLRFYFKSGGVSLQCHGMESRDRHVLLQYSTDGGISWSLLEELVGGSGVTRLIHAELPKHAKTGNTIFRWWQPSHGPADQWTLDEIDINQYHRLQAAEDDFERNDIYDNKLWMTVTEGMLSPYCQSPGKALVLSNQQTTKMALTRDLLLKDGDVIQFKINVGCSKSFSFEHPVWFEYSPDNGKTWQLVTESCYPDDHCHGNHREGSVYFRGTYGVWSMVVLPVSPKMTTGRVNLRWRQDGEQMMSFALDDVYIGHPCPEMCNNHGVCVGRICQCEVGYQGPNCTSNDQYSQIMVDRFDTFYRPASDWQVIYGGRLGMGCGILDFGPSLYFSGEGSRQAVTKPLDATQTKVLQFTARIGSRSEKPGCSKPRDRNEAIVVDYSTDHGILWETLDLLDPFALSSRPQSFDIALPPEAKTVKTMFRWWQPLVGKGAHRAQWAIDNVVVGVKENNKDSFEENFSPIQADGWYRTQNAIPMRSCNANDNVLWFSKNGFGDRYAETWDYQVTESSLLQFDISMACGGQYTSPYDVGIEYSTDMGRNWRPLVEECLPPRKDCTDYKAGSFLKAQEHRNWTRVTSLIPRDAVSQATRFRWRQYGKSTRGNLWAIDNIYLGNGCEWMCSGHGYCAKKKCVCDPGYSGDFCVAAKALSTSIIEPFDAPQSRDTWRESYGGEISNMCGTVVSDMAMTFHKSGLRMLISKDIDTSKALHAQFNFRFGCNEEGTSLPEENMVLLQYSNNGGISWGTLSDIYYNDQARANKGFYSIPLPPTAKHNSTRFKFWQPKTEGQLVTAWSLDNLFIGGSETMNPSVVYDTFDGEPNSDHWLFWPGGSIGSFCDEKMRPGSVMTGSSSMVFYQSEIGEHSIMTQDIDLMDKTVIQFELNIGCNTKPTSLYPVSLEYSTDHGVTWNLIIAPCTHAPGSCDDNMYDPTIYYSGTTAYWKRVTVPLTGIKHCGTARFRWYQGDFTSPRNPAPSWSIDNVYIGMKCDHHCSGHGSCINGLFCQCDEFFQEGPTCRPSLLLPRYLKDDFEGIGVDTAKWLVHTGEVSGYCGDLFTGSSVYFHGNGDRVLTTRDLDLTSARFIQFYLRLGCRPSLLSLHEPPVLLQLSTNGGITWQTLETFTFKVTDVQYVSIEFPDGGRGNATRVRWYQPSAAGVFTRDWAIDQVYIGGDTRGIDVLNDEDSPESDFYWLMVPGSKKEVVCGSAQKAMHFFEAGRMRYAVTTDLLVTESTYVYAEISLGCEEGGDTCFAVHLDFSMDMGKTWRPVLTDCFPSKTNCTTFYHGSVFNSDVYTGWNRVVIPLPQTTGSKATRFRWMQPGGFKTADTWAIRNVYIGNECPYACLGRGRCRAGHCRCYGSWHGISCQLRKTPLPTFLREHFNDNQLGTDWMKAVGGQPSHKCGHLASGTAMHFTGGCSRQLVTRDLNLTSATFLEFHFRLGCLSLPTERDHGVLVDYSTDGGTHWHLLTELYHTQYRNPSFVSLKLPGNARMLGTVVRWWQPRNTGPSGADWAIDNIFIGGHQQLKTSLTSDFSTGDADWLQMDNANLGPFCGSDEALTATPAKRENASLVTNDVKIEDGYMLQFNLSVGCNAPWNRSISPIVLEYSTDFGLTWSYLVRGCSGSSGVCAGQEAPPSVFFNHKGWKLYTFALEGRVRSSNTRFRWKQVDLLHGSSEQQQSWAIDDVYVGRACSSYCSGQGRCDFPSCVCEDGFVGEDCRLSSGRKETILEDFHSGLLDRDSWLLVQGGDVGVPCGPGLTSPSLVFSGAGIRLVQSRTLDLRNGRYVQYIAQIGGNSQAAGCSPPTSSEDSVVFQYSTNGGISWRTIHILEPSGYGVSRRDYIVLPPSARTHSTSFRWWQAVQSDSQLPVTWAIDDVIIGGQEINPSTLYNDFSEESHLDLEFFPNGRVEGAVCNRPGMAMVWEKTTGAKMVTTRPLIVQHGHIIQFKLSIGCTELHSSAACYRGGDVRLEYSRHPSDDTWRLVKPVCLPGTSSDFSCQPYMYHSGTVFTADRYRTWRRVTVVVPPQVFSSSARIRWRQARDDIETVSWSIDEIYVGEGCPQQCNGRGQCVEGACRCDRGYVGDTCVPMLMSLIANMLEGFEAGVTSAYWESVIGGGVGIGCGILLPHSHGKTLYFNGCGSRQAVTRELDTSQSTKIMFVLRVGSVEQSDTCHLNLNTNTTNKAVLLQYTTDKGISWHLLASHDPMQYIRPQKVSYDLPHEAMARGVQFRWWQPVHDGFGHDQWAIDYVEVVRMNQAAMVHHRGVPRRRQDTMNPFLPYR